MKKLLPAFMLLTALSGCQTHQRAVVASAPQSFKLPEKHIEIHKRLLSEQKRLIETHENSTSHDNLD